ncbi:putative nuclear RNA export factor SDE5 [Christensenellaceae bacterium OttesenSCG-928-L17]|nr:putative nuclear RNA export factor SDE5 [Christensenellaceae bacterium OttesenSCG-928-L17]
MPRNPDIDRLKAIADQAFAAKQAAYDRMKPLGQRRHDMNDRLNSSWDEVCSARDEMNSAYERQQNAWESYKSERDSISAQIDSVAQDADRAHEAMKDAFERASYAYESGDKASAPFYASEGRDYQYERNSYNEEKARLISIAKSMTPPSSDFHHYKERYNSLMDSHKALQAEYKSVKAQHEAARDEFDRAKQQCDAAKAAFERAIEAERAKWRDESCRECGATIRVNIEWSHPPKYCKHCKEKFKAQKDRIASAAGKSADDVKVRFNPATGKNDVYFGGIGEADGHGHGHAVVSDTGKVHYLRDATFGDRKDAIIIDDGKKTITFKKGADLFSLFFSMIIFY